MTSRVRSAVVAEQVREAVGDTQRSGAVPVTGSSPPPDPTYKGMGGTEASVLLKL